MSEVDLRFLTQNKRAHAGVRQRLSAFGKTWIAIFLIVVFEGAARKWISEGLTVPLVLGRDLIALWTIVIAIKRGHLKPFKAGGLFLLIWSLVVLFWALIQAIGNDIPFDIVAIGLRFWLLYLWFAVASALAVTEHDLKVILRLIGAVMIVSAPLVIVQYLQPPTAFINKQVSNDEDDLIFTVVFGVVRTTGTFSFTLGYSIFLALIYPVAFTFLTANANTVRQRAWHVAVLVAAALGTLVSGSRTAFAHFFVAAVIYVLYLFVISRVRLKMRTYLAVAAGIMMLGVLTIALSGALSALEERATGATESEDVSARVTEMFIGSQELRENFEILGTGIGYGANFAGVVLTGERAFLNGENEVERTLFSGGLLGLIFLGAKLLLCGWGVRRGYAIARLGSPLPILFWATAALALFTWAVMGQLTANAMGFLVLGLALSTMRFPRVGAIK